MKRIHVNVTQENLNVLEQVQKELADCGPSVALNVIIKRYKELKEQKKENNHGNV